MKIIDDVKGLEACTQKELALQVVLRWDEHFRSAEMAADTAAVIIQKKIDLLSGLNTDDFPDLEVKLKRLIEEIKAVL